MWGDLGRQPEGWLYPVYANSENALVDEGALLESGGSYTEETLSLFHSLHKYADRVFAVVHIRAVLRLLYTIAAVPKPGGSILYGDGLEDFGDGLFQDLGSASFGGAEQLLQLRPGLLDRIEIG